MNPVAPVRGRITGKRPPDRDYVVVSDNAVPKEVMAKKRQKRGNVMAKSDTAVREKKAVQILWRQLLCGKSTYTRVRKLHGRNGSKA